MHDIPVLIRIFAVLAVLFGIPLILALRAMAREMREDARLGLNSAMYERLTRKFSAIALSAAVLGMWYQSWLLVLGFGGFAAVMVAIVTFNRRRVS